VGTEILTFHVMLVIFDWECSKHIDK